MTKNKRAVQFYEFVDIEHRRVPPLKTDEVVNLIEALDPVREAAYYSQRSGQNLHGRIARHAPTVGDVLVLARIRLGEDLRVHRMTDGTYRTLMFADTEGQAEETHVGFFDNNVVGLMRNSQMSPTHPRVEEYIYDKLRWDEPLRLVPLVFVDRIAQLRRDNEYTRQAVVKLPAYEYARVSPDSRFYRNVFRMAEDEFGPVVLELSIKVPTRGEQDAADRVFSEFQTLVRSDAPIEKLQITYADRESERAASANLLNDILAMRVDVSVEKSEDPGGVDVIAVTDFSAAQGIRRAYEQLRPEIDRALGSGE